MTTPEKDHPSNKVPASDRMSPEERSRRARIGAYTLHSRHDSRELTAAARKSFLDRFDRELDPEGVLAPQERARRAELARKAISLA